MNVFQLLMQFVVLLFVTIIIWAVCLSVHPSVSPAAAAGANAAVVDATDLHFFLVMLFTVYSLCSSCCCFVAFFGCIQMRSKKRVI